MFHLAPSILAADFWRLGEQVAEVEAAGADRLHIDVMDGHFVPNLSMGPLVVQALRPRTRLPLEVHLMVEEPEIFIDPFLKAGADIVVFHWEAIADPRPLLDQIHAAGKKAGLAINPDAPTSVLDPYLDLIDVALCMTVFPGFGGQPMVAESPQRVHQLRARIHERGATCDLEVDGGVDIRTAPALLQSGANVLVVGNALFRHAQSATQAIRELRKLSA